MDGKSDKRIYTLSEENPYAAVIKLGVPLILGMFIMVLYNLVDTYFIGLTGDDYQLAAVNLSYPVMMVTVALANMVGTGASSLILMLDHLFGFTGMLWAQPVTELIMMCASTVLMLTVIRGHEKATSL